MDLSRGLLDTIIIINICVGAIECFLGYRIFKFILWLTGFAVGIALGAAGASVMSFDSEIVITMALACGVLLGWAFLALYVVGIFVLGACLGALVCAVGYAMADVTPEPAVLLILSVFAGIIAVKFKRLIIILATSFEGAWSVVTGIGYFTRRGVSPFAFDRLLNSVDTYFYAVIVSWLALGILGAMVQSATSPERDISAQPAPPPYGSPADGSPPGEA